MKRFLSALLALTLAAGLTACSKPSATTTAPIATGDSDATTSAPAQSSDAEPTTTEAPTTEDPNAPGNSPEHYFGLEGSYTYTILIHQPENSWSPLDVNWSESHTLEYITDRFYLPLWDQGSGTLEYVYSLAVDEPVDVTAYLAADRPEFGIPAGAEKGYAFSIRLNPNAHWDDGTPITADSYVDSLKLLLDPLHLHAGAGNVASGELELAGAAEYNSQKIPVYRENVLNNRYGMNNLEKGENGVYRTPEGGIVYWALNYPLEKWLEGGCLYDVVVKELPTESESETAAEETSEESTPEETTEAPAEEATEAAEPEETTGSEAAGQAEETGAAGEAEESESEEEKKPESFDKTYWTELAGSMNEDGLVPLTDESYEWFRTLVCDGTWGTKEESLPAYWIYSEPEKNYDWDNVGMYAYDVYELTVVFRNPIEEAQVKAALNRLTNLLLPGAEETLCQNYNRTLEENHSFGPYKVTAVEPGKEIHLERNPEWWGYQGLDLIYRNESDGKWYSLYQTTDISVQTTDKPLLGQFLAGNGMSILLDREEGQAYAGSSWAYTIPSGTTLSIALNDNTAAATAREEDEEFDRESYDLETLTLESFHDAVALACASIFDDRAETDLEKARELFRKAFEEALEKGYIADANENGVLDEEIRLTTAFSSDSAALKETVEKVAKAIETAVEGTGFAGSVSFRIAEVDEDYRTSFEEGKIDFIFERTELTDTMLVSKRLELLNGGWSEEFGLGGIAGIRYTMTDAEWSDYVSSQNGTLKY